MRVYFKPKSCDPKCNHVIEPNCNRKLKMKEMKIISQQYLKVKPPPSFVDFLVRCNNSAGETLIMMLKQHSQPRFVCFNKLDDGQFKYCVLCISCLVPSLFTHLPRTCSDKYHIIDPSIDCQHS